jgi:hypothetical protein
MSVERIGGEGPKELRIIFFLRLLFAVANSHDLSCLGLLEFVFIHIQGCDGGGECSLSRSGVAGGPFLGYLVKGASTTLVVEIRDSVLQGIRVVGVGE